MIKAVIFDWGGVLIENPASELMAYCASYLGTTSQKFTTTYLKYEKLFQKNQIAENELWRVICAKLKVEVPKIKSLWGKAVKSVFRENKDVTAIALKLKESGYKIGFLSNTEIPTAKYFKKQSYNFFDVAVFSCFEGFVKPQQEIFEIILNKLKVKPEEAIFRKEHVEGARRLGIQAILFKDAKHLMRDLKHLSIKLN